MQFAIDLCFNTQPPEGGWAAPRDLRVPGGVSTHSRPKAAGLTVRGRSGRGMVSTHSRPKAAGCDSQREKLTAAVSTHSRPKAAGPALWRMRRCARCFNTQPPEGGWHPVSAARAERAFQHTAARRRLGRWRSALWRFRRFNTQPPEGGWVEICPPCAHNAGFNTQPPEGGWWEHNRIIIAQYGFQHTAARRRLVLTGRINA